METISNYKIIQTKNFKKQVEKCSSKMKQHINEAFSNIISNPHQHTNIKKLSGNLSQFYRYRIGGYRLIYSIEEHELVIVAVQFAPRGDVYKHL